MQPKQRILIVDDERIVLDVTRLSLEMLKPFTVTAHLDPIAALAEFEADPAGFALVVTDFKMPGMNGAELATQMRRLNPLVPILCISAYLKPGPAGDGLFTSYLPKPFEIEELHAVVQELTGMGMGLPHSEAALLRSVA